MDTRLCVLDVWQVWYMMCKTMHCCLIKFTGLLRGSAKDNPVHCRPISYYVYSGFNKLIRVRVQILISAWTLVYWPFIFAADKCWHYGSKIDQHIIWLQLKQRLKYHFHVLHNPAQLSLSSKYFPGLHFLICMLADLLPGFWFPSPWYSVSILVTSSSTQSNYVGSCMYGCLDGDLFISSWHNNI